MSSQAKTVSIEDLTEREKQILCMLSLDNDEIASRVYVSSSAVKLHVSRLMLAFKSSNRTEVSLKALKQKVIDIEQIVLD